MSEKRWFFYLIAFIEGASLMSIEILSGKIITPYYGASLYVWTAVFGFTLIGLALGYFLGGVLSEKTDNTTVLISIYLLSSIFVITMPFISSWILEKTLSFELRLGISISCIVFLLPAIICFGMISPFLVRIISKNVSQIGYSAGVIYTVSTIGGIIFTFLLGFYLISTLGIRNSTFLIGVMLLIPVIIFYLLNLKKNFFNKQLHF